MGLAVRIIPTILHSHGNLIKGERFAGDRVVGNALQAARIYAKRGVDELVLLDITATKEGREPNYDMVRKLSDGCFAPLTVGGGVRTVEHVRNLLNAGADKVCIGTEYVRDPNLISKCAGRFGSQALVVSVDYKPVKVLNGDYVLGACVQCGQTPALIEGMCMHPLTLAMKMEEYGAGEILLQSVERDGTMQGYDLDLIEAVTQAVGIPVIASGGCSGYEDMYQAIQAGASGVAAGALFTFTDATPKEAARYLSEKGVEVRLG